MSESEVDQDKVREVGWVSESVFPRPTPHPPQVLETIRRL